MARRSGQRGRQWPVVVGAAVAVAVSSPILGAGIGAATEPPPPDETGAPRVVELAELPPEPTPPSAPSEPPIDELVDAIDDGDRDPTDLRGSKAVETLESTGLLDDVAANAGVDEGELVDELLDDPTMFVAATGDLGYVEMLPTSGGDDHDHHHHDDDHGDDHGDERLEADVGHDGDGPLAPSLLTGSAFDLHSNEGSGATLYLDFNGHTTTSGVWESFGFGLPIVSQPFDRDGSPSSFSSAEQQEIYEIWLRVAEDYAPFGVDVTTDPTVQVDQRVVVSPTNIFAPLVANWQGILGVAIVGSFGEPSEIPAFVFTGSGAGHLPTKWTAEAISHEAGHTFGLRHDGRRDGSTVEEYYGGHGDWAPIMGLAIERPVAQWSRGEYRCANRTENDIDVIARLVGYRSDDWPSAPSVSPAISGTGTTSGIIGAGSDVDALRVGTSGGPTTITVRPAGPSPNLHPEVTVRSSTGTVLGVGAPTAPAGPATVSLSSVAPGWFSIEVRPSAWYGPIAGFGTYGSMGVYEVSVTDGFTPPDLAISRGGSSVASAVGLDRRPIC